MVNGRPGYAREAGKELKRGNQDLLRALGIQGNRAALDPEHALPATAGAEHLDLAARKHAHLGHARAVSPVSFDPAHPEAFPAAGRGQRRGILGQAHAVRLTLALFSPGEGTGKFRGILGHALPRLISLVRYTKHLSLSKDFARENIWKM